MKILKLLGQTVWFDQELSGGQVWWNQILEAIRNCDVFIFVLSPDSLNSVACKLEYKYAAELGKSILPVLIAEGVSFNLLSPALSQVQFVDYLKRDRDAAFRLAKALTVTPSSQTLPSPLPLPPDVPISYLGGLTEQIETTYNLSYEEQSTLVVNLRQGIRDPETSADTLTLLKRFRCRKDLFATIAEEIDEVLESTIKSTVTTSQSSEAERPPQKQVLKKDKTVTSVDKIQPSEHERVIRTFWGAILGITFGGTLL